MKLSELSPAALKAAMKGGTAQWGKWGSANDHFRYAESNPELWRFKCRCGCGGRTRATGRANGITLYMGCELSVARWVKTGDYRTSPAGRRALEESR